MESKDAIDLNVKDTINIDEVIKFKAKNFKIINKIGILYALALIINVLFDDLVRKLINFYFSNFSKKYKSDATLICVLINNQIFLVLIIFLLTLCVKKVKFIKKSYTCKKYFINFLISDGLLIPGFLFGYVIHFLLVFFMTKKNYNDTSESLIFEEINNSNIFLKFIIMSITGPISEEIIFRKFLVDRLANYSKTLAIFASGIMFGIFHLNLQQFFGAMFFGWAMAYTYVETGNIFITMSYHVLENSYSIVLQSLLIYHNKYILIICYALIILRIITCLSGFVILILLRKKIKVTDEENNSSDKWKFFKSYGMWIYVVVGIIITCIVYKLKYF